jgi:hypothetical protein
MNAQERLAYLLESVWVPTNRQVLFADITATVGLEATALVVGTMKAASAANPLMDTIIIAMSTVGLSLSSPERQGVIDSLAIAGEWPDAVRDAVKALGGINRPRWQSEGYSSEPTLEQITIELAKQDWRERFDAILNQIGTVEQADGVAALRVMADEMEAV